MKVIIAALAATCFTPFAHAEVSTAIVQAYNQALETKKLTDISRTAETLASEATKNADDPQAVLFAFEAAWTLCNIGQCEKALSAAKFSIDQPDTGAHPVMADRNLLLAFASWSVEPNKAARADLDKALDAMDGVEPSLLSIRAFNDRYRVDTKGSDRDTLKRTARAAREHMEQIADLVPDQLAVANFIEAQAAWGGPIRSTDQMRMEHAKWQLAVLMADDNYKSASGIADLRWQAEAWTTAMRSYAIAVQRARGPNKITAGKFPGMTPDEAREIATQYAPRLAKLSKKDEPPICRGALNEQPDRAPRGRDQVTGYVGSVIIGMDVRDGELQNVRVLAAVPDDRYTQFALDAVKDLHWKKSDDQPDENCRESFDDFTVPFNFTFQ